MQYDPIKRSLGRFFTGPVFLRKILYFLLDLLLLRTWYVKRALKNTARYSPNKSFVLDAGAGFGQYTWRMSRKNPDWKIKAVDISQEHVNDCERFFKAAGLSDRITCEQQDLTKLDDDNMYSIILCVDVMEHIKEDELVFSNFYHALKQEGALIISTPSNIGGSDVHAESDHSFIDEHVRDGYGAGEISQKLHQAGFRDVLVSFTYGKPGNIAWRISMKYPIKMLNTSKAFFLLLPFYYMIFFPIAAILNIFDLCFTHESGTGLLVSARK